MSKRAEDAMWQAWQKYVRWGLWVMLPLALFPLAAAFQAGRDAEAATHWQAVPAVGIAAEARTSCGKGCVHRVLLTYEYRVDGQTYTGSRLYFGNESLASEEDAKRVARDLGDGKNFMVFVDPMDASVSAVHVGNVGPRTWIAASAPLMAYTVAWLAYFVMWRLIRTVQSGTP